MGCYFANLRGIATDQNMPENSIKPELLNEELIYGIKKTADELISLIWFLQECKKTGLFPSKIKVDAIGEALKRSEKYELDICKDHEKILRKINDLANCFKHSFVQSALGSMVGMEGPRIYALALGRNNTVSSNPVYYEISVVDLVQQFESFYLSSQDWLKTFTEEQRANQIQPT